MLSRKGAPIHITPRFETVSSAVWRTKPEGIYLDTAQNVTSDIPDEVADIHADTARANGTTLTGKLSCAFVRQTLKRPDNRALPKRCHDAFQFLVQFRLSLEPFAD